MPQNKLQQKIQQLKQEGQKITNLSFADFTCFPSLLEDKKIQSAFTRLFQYPYYYPVAQGDLEARQTLCQYYQKYGQKIAPEQLIITTGLQQSYLYLFKLFSAENGEILLSRPHHPQLEEIADFLGLRLQKFDLDSLNNWQIDLASLKRKISDKTKAIFISSPDLPTGAVQSDQILTELLQLIEGQNIALIVDESLADFIFSKVNYPIVANLASPEQLIITINSLNYGFALPGIKLSWLTLHGPSAHLQNLIQSIEFLSDTFSGPSQIEQSILPDLISNSEKWRYKFQQQVEKNRDLLIKKIKKIPQSNFQMPQGGLYAVVTFPDWSINSEDLAYDLLDYTGIYLHPLSYYGLKTVPGLVISFLQDYSVLNKSLQKICKYLADR